MLVLILLDIKSVRFIAVVVNFSHFWSVGLAHDNK
jgi:hypothetical protein